VNGSQFAAPMTRPTATPAYSKLPTATTKRSSLSFKGIAKVKVISFHNTVETA